VADTLGAGVSRVILLFRDWYVNTASLNQMRPGWRLMRAPVARPGLGGRLGRSKDELVAHEIAGNFREGAPAFVVSGGCRGSVNPLVLRVFRQSPISSHVYCLASGPTTET